MKELIINLILTYFRILAKVQLLKNRKAQIIGVTGSAGKSSALEAIAAILQEDFEVKVGRKANSESGIPLNILGLSPKNYSSLDWLRLLFLAPFKLITNWEKYDVYLVEMGIDGPLPPKNMGYLLSILQPNIGVFLSVGAMHTEQFDQVVLETDPSKRTLALTKAIAAEKAKLINSLPSKGLGIISADNPLILESTKKAKAPLLTFGFSDNANLVCTKIAWDASSTSFTFSSDDTITDCHIKNYYLPKHFGATFAAALAVAHHLGISLYRGCGLLESHFELPPGRASLIAGQNGSTILDSSYNASSQPVLDFLELLPKLPQKKRVYVLGDMRELGSAAKEEHHKVANALVKSVTENDQVILVGPNMHSTVYPILSEKKIHTQWFENAGKAIKAVKETLSPDTIVFVKGSQNTIFLEIIIEAIMENPNDAEKILCRRGDFWDSKRAAFAHQ